MAKAKTTKRALLASTLSILLCVAMLVGTTYAWFTDSVTSGKNRIVAGNLDVELYVVNGEEETPVGENTNLFMEDALWEPGHVEVVNLKVANLGSLALKYSFGINIEDEKGGTNVAGDPFNLSDYIMFALIEGNNTYETRDEAIAAAEKKAVKLSALAVDENGVLYPAEKATKENPASRYVTLVVYMPTTVGNEANYKTGTDAPTIDLGVTLLATQTPYEDDSFGNDYDRVSGLLLDGYVEVKTPEALTAALAEGKNVVLTEDIKVTGSVLKAAEGTVIDGNGNKLIGLGTDGEHQGLQLAKNVEYRNIVFELEKGWGVITKSATFINCTFNAASPYLTPTVGGDIVVDGCTLVDTVLQICYNEGEHVDPATIKTTIINNKFIVNNTDVRAHAMVLGGGSPEFWANGAETVTMTGNTFTPKHEDTSYIAYYIYGDYNTTLTSVPVYKNNTFNGDVNYSMNGTAAENQYPLSREAKVETADDLDKALKDPDVKKVSLANDITTTMTVNSEKEIELNGNTVAQYGNSVIVKQGADVTIKNGTIKDVGSSKSVDIEYGSNVTFENVKFEMTIDQLINNSTPAYTAVGIRANKDTKTTVTFKNCTFTNQGFEVNGMNGDGEIDVKFENCTFNAVAKVEGDKSLGGLSALISVNPYNLYGNIEITNCTFNYSGYLRDSNWKANAIYISGFRNSNEDGILTLTLEGNTFNLSDAAEGNALSFNNQDKLVVNKDF